MMIESIYTKCSEALAGNVPHTPEEPNVLNGML